MSTGTALEPGAGDPWRIRALADARSTASATLRRTQLTLTEIADAPDTGWRGEAQRAFSSTIATLAPDLTLLAQGLDTQSAALYVYAEQVARLGDEQRTLVASRSGTSTELDTTRDRWRTALAHTNGPYITNPEAQRTAEALAEHVGILEARLASIQSQWDALVTRRRTADATCIAALTGEDVLGRTAGLSARTIATTPPAQLLALLANLSAPDLKALLAAHSDLADRLSSLRPTEIASWWAGLDNPEADPASGDHQPSPAQAALIAGIPTIIGTLGGLPAWARDRANRLVLADALTRLRTAPPADPRLLQGLEQIDKTLTTEGLTLLSLDLTAPPLAAIAVGDLDRAKYVSFLVPGMNTSTAIPGNLTAYVGAAGELRGAAAVGGGTEPSEVAAVAWLGYQPPMNENVSEVWFDERAEDGAVKLSGALTDLQASRSGVPPQVSVVAHSYGGVVAAIALTSAKADSVAFLGSVGVPTRGASELNVPAGAVFASQAAHDGWAPVGQALAGHLGRPRFDPTDSSFGAQVFSSEEAVIDGVTLHGVTRHGPFGDGAGEYSYFTGGTTAQFFLGKVVTGHGAAVPTAR